MIVWVMLYISLLCYPLLQLKFVVYIQSDEMNSHIQNGTWREKPTSVFYQQKVGQCKTEVILGIQYANIVGWECHGLLWEVDPGNFGPNKSPFIRTFSHMISHAILWNAIPSWYAFAFSFEYRAGTHQSPKNFPHILATFTYSTEKHRWSFFVFFVFLP